MGQEHFWLLLHLQEMERAPPCLKKEMIWIALFLFLHMSPPIIATIQKILDPTSATVLTLHYSEKKTAHP